MTSLRSTSPPQFSPAAAFPPMSLTPLKLVKTPIPNYVGLQARRFFSPLVPGPRLAPQAQDSKRSIERQLGVYLQHQYPPRQRQSYQIHKRPSSQNGTMAFLLPGLRGTLLLTTPLILSTPLLAHQFRHRQQIRCDGPDPITKITNDLTRSYTSEAQTPIITQSGTVNPKAIRQVSLGSILGVVGGLGISVFSKPLAILIGLGIFVVQVSCDLISYCLENRVGEPGR